MAWWFPAEYNPDNEGSNYGARAQALHHRFWGAVAIVVGTVALLLLIQGLRQGGIPVAGDDWFRVGAVIFALVAALGRGGWAIQSWDGETVIERIDRGMYMVAQLGAGALLILVITL